MFDFDGPDWMDIGLAGALAEEIAKESKECERIRKEVEGDQDEDDDRENEQKP